MTQVRFKVKKGDLVEVTTGRNKGQRGVVQKVLLDDSKVVVDGVNKVIRNMKPSALNPQGGQVEKTHPIHISNVAVVNPQSDKIEKVGVRKNTAGKNERFFKKTGNTILKV
ncbi:MAG: 50S ribosomal protein L24 [Pseudomonadota bacterium]|jgi:large subunit ribosomal protein L24|nr:50S ribosomal protein L24 [Alphaproteobacteria bacterium]